MTLIIYQVQGQIENNSQTDNNEFEYEVSNCVPYLEMNWTCETLDG